MEGLQLPSIVLGPRLKVVKKDRLRSLKELLS